MCSAYIRHLTIATHCFHVSCICLVMVMSYGFKCRHPSILNSVSFRADKQYLWMSTYRMTKYCVLSSNAMSNNNDDGGVYRFVICKSRFQFTKCNAVDTNQ